MSEALEPKLDQLQEALRARVRHSSAHFPELDRLFPGSYPRVLVRGEGAYVVDEHGRRLLDGGGHLGACSVGHGREEIGLSDGRAGRGRSSGRRWTSASRIPSLRSSPSG